MTLDAWFRFVAEFLYQAFCEKRKNQGRCFNFMFPYIPLNITSKNNFTEVNIFHNNFAFYEGPQY